MLLLNMKDTSFFQRKIKKNSNADFVGDDTYVLSFGMPLFTGSNYIRKKACIHLCLF